MSEHGPRSSFESIEDNVGHMYDLLAETKLELEEKLFIMDNLLPPIFDPDGRVASLRASTEKSLQNLSQKGNIVEGLMSKYQVDIRVDDIFLSEMLLLAERHLITPTGKRDSIFFEHENQIVAKSIVNLSERRLSEWLEEYGEEAHEVTISGDRTFKFFLSGDTERVRMDIPKVTDPYLHKVEIGPEAADQILGGKLTPEDYTKIAETLLSLEGKAGKATRKFAQATKLWAQLYASGSVADKALVVRKMRAFDLREVFGGDDPRVAPFCDIPLNSIYLHVVKDFPQIKLDHLPQPFESEIWKEH